MFAIGATLAESTVSVGWSVPGESWKMSPCAVSGEVFFHDAVRNSCAPVGQSAVAVKCTCTHWPFAASFVFGMSRNALSVSSAV